MSNRSGHIDLGELRARLARADGPRYWRTLEDLARATGICDKTDGDPGDDSRWIKSLDRRNFLALMGASCALAGLSGCTTRKPHEDIVPYVHQPEDMVLGKALYFATAMPLGGCARPVLVASHEGRPTKIEGNPEHPMSLGATDVFAQASILGLYDPDRSQTVTYGGQLSSWQAFLSAARGALEGQRERKGAGLRILTEIVSSPTLAAQIRELLKQFPEAQWVQYEPLAGDNAHEGARLAFGEYVDVHCDLEKADVILSLDSDFLGDGPYAVRHARQFAGRRQVDNERAEVNRLYVVETGVTCTGSMADHRLAVRPTAIEKIARALAAAVGVPGATTPPGEAPLPAKWFDVLVRDLKAHPGACVVMAGEQQPPVVHALVHAVNFSLGNAGKTVSYTDTVDAAPANHGARMGGLVKDMSDGKVELLLILGCNPVYTVPSSLMFSDHLRKIAFSAHVGPYEDETFEYCQWHVPEAHYLESWGDSRSADGTVTIQQPLIAPLYDGRSALEVVSALLGQSDHSAYEIVREHWKTKITGVEFDQVMRRALHDGFVRDSALPRRQMALKLDPSVTAGESPEPAGVEVVVRPDPGLYDGRFANNGWLQELPRPFTHLTWDNAALIAPALAERLSLQDGDMVAWKQGAFTIEAPVLIVPGHADGAVTVHLGHGRSRAGKVGSSVGFDAYPALAAGWISSGADLQKSGGSRPLALARAHHSMENRPLVVSGTVEEYRKEPGFVHETAEEPERDLSIYPEHKYENHAWGMAIDLSVCTGCGVCVLACQAENNIPIVGKDQVIRGREMHWIRVDQYYSGDLDHPAMFSQPVPCMQCERAPCEPVCPVHATAHSSEGLNDMSYNRCVGTRYCSNNCPYKVRRFNFYQYSDMKTPALKLAANPNVTLRQRGVMEKCTYCVQRINIARVRARGENRAVRDGEILTACQAACPARAIVFGDINDPGSEVAKLKARQRNYALLGDLNTRPRTTYLAALRNPNPELEEA